jgi:predicted alpha/beta hydrolase
VLSRFAAVTAPILAICVTDDDIGSAAAIRRTLSYYCNAERIEAGLSPSHYGFDAIGHFSLFHSRHADGFWKDTLSWLKNGVNPFERSTSV